MPGDLLKLHIVFKSTTGGIYTEKWQFVTHPTMLSGAMLLLTLRGVAIQEDKFQKRRISIEVEPLSSLLVVFTSIKDTFNDVYLTITAQSHGQGSESYCSGHDTISYIYQWKSKNSLNT